MNNRQESMLSALAVALLLFTAMLDPLISSALAIILLIVFSVYKYIQSNSTPKR